MSTKDKIADLVSEWHRQRGDELSAALAWCESPIEQLFLLGCLTGGWSLEPTDSDYTGYRAWDDCKEHGVIDHAHRFLFAGSADGLIVVQANTIVEGRRFRIDFAYLSAGEKFAIELDGHDFHERTKEQARRDKSRDRALTKANWRVLHFTGSEVYADVADVVWQVREHGLDAVDRLWEASKKKEVAKR